MKILLAFDSFKGCMDSEQAAKYAKKAILKADPTHEVQEMVIGDGGEGTMKALTKGKDCVYRSYFCRDTYGKKIQAPVAYIDEGQTAIIEVAKILGLNLYAREERKPLYSSSYGVGQVLKEARKSHVRKIMLLLGGSGNHDGGMGMLEALGMKFYDKEHRILHGKAMNLEKIDAIDARGLLDFSTIECIAAYDVNNSLLGDEGATMLYGKQKGFYPNQLARMEKAMAHYNEKMKAIGYELNTMPAGGSCGGLSASFQAACKAKPVHALDYLFQEIDMEKAIQDADLIITGEGQSDYQTQYGKVPAGIVHLANRYQKPCVCVSGALGLGYQQLYELGFIGIYSIADRAMSFEKALAQAPEKLEATIYALMKTIQYYN